MKQVVIFGTGSLAQLTYYYFQKIHVDHVVGFVVDQDFKKNDTLMGLPVISVHELKSVFSSKTHDMLVAIGYSNMRNRSSVVDRMKNKGYQLTNLIPLDGYEGGVIGENNIIFPGSVIEPFSVIGNNNVFWSGSHICHDVKVNDNNFFASGSTIGGYVNVSCGCFFGFNSTIVEEVIIAEETLVAAGAVVLKNTEACCKYMGVPAVNVGNHEETGIIF